MERQEDIVPQLVDSKVAALVAEELATMVVAVEAATVAGTHVQAPIAEGAVAAGRTT